MNETGTPWEVLRADLAHQQCAEPDQSSLTRGLYATDASLYRVVPEGVAHPRSREELAALVDACLAAGVPLTTRGAGTSCAGNAVGPGLVVDTARHLTTITGLDPAARTATVEPGVVQDVLSCAAQRHGLRYGPDPSTASRCTIGGMIGNNACGPRAQGYGRTSDNVVALEVITGTGERLSIDSRVDLRTTDSPTLAALQTLVQANLGTIRTQFGTFSRQVSGYALEWLLPERGFDVAKFLAGSEGTLAVITTATVALVADDPHKVMVALGYPTMAEAADAMPAILPFSPTAVEGMDARIVDVVRRTLGPTAVPDLPAGAGWVFVELTDTDQPRLADRAADLVRASGCLDGRVVTDPAITAALWKIRSDGAGLAGVSLEGAAHAGWEDAAVPPDRLGSYLRDFDALLGRHGLQGLPYGHFGDGCVHCRIDFPLTQEPDGAHRYRAFIEEAATLVASYGGSMSGEHGDGRARSELLPVMYTPEARALFAAVKQIFDPENLLNPGVLVDPAPLDADLRAPAVRRSPLFNTHRGFIDDVHRCTGVGRCVASTGTGVMCPSWQATREEKDSTRGRARVLQEMINGTLITDGWRSPEVHEALDLCLSCKGCSRDCPTGTDMAAYKSTVLHEAYRGRVRPVDHYTMGWLPRWGRLISSLPVVPHLANTALALPGLGWVAKKLAGIDVRRGVPRFAAGSQRRRLGRDLASGSITAADAPTGRGEVVLWVDSFSDAFAGDQVVATAAVLILAGFAPRILERKACCGLTWITTGQLEGAARELRNATEVLHPFAARGVPIVGTEPSCLAVWRSDALDLLDDPRVRVVADHTFTLAELLARDSDLVVPDLTGHTVVAQPHCHEASVMGWDAERELLHRTGATVITVDGCCGLAGNHGMMEGHYAFSRSVFDTHLGPALTDAGPEAIVLADGFSCRTQMADLEGRTSVTLAELLIAHA
ncbi:MAG: FAD-binding and (Fe-S)-binding domain-containing protein [Propioniciclava sp.]